MIFFILLLFFSLLESLMFAILDIYAQEVTTLFLANPVAQSVGFLAMFVWILWFLVQNDRTTVKIFILSCIFWLWHFYLLGNWGAFWATFIGFIRLILSLKYQKSISILVWVLACSLAYGVYSFDGKVISTLPLLATAISSYGFFFLEKIRLRILLAGVSLLWFTYHLNTGSMSGILNEIIVQCTIWYSVLLFATWHEKKQKILERLKAKIWRAPARLNFGRYVFFRDKDRFN